MKKVFFSLIGVSLLLFSCTKRSDTSSSEVGFSSLSSEESESFSSESSEIPSSEISPSEVSSSEEKTSSEFSELSSSSSEEISSSTSEESSSTSSIEDDFDIITTPSIRMPAEFEPLKAVTTIYPINMPLEVYKEIAEDDKMIVLVNPNDRGKSRITEATNYFTNSGVNMKNVSFVDCQSDYDGGCWIRDCSPFYVFNDKELGIVDFTYNRPQRVEQNSIPSVLANYFDMSYSKMDIVHTGGNLMQDGRGAAMSDDLVIQENNNNVNKVRTLMEQYTGVDNYHITIDPQGDYIAHIDCWGKIVAPDKIIVARLPKSNSRYQYYEQVADYFANQQSCYGYPYRVYRIDEPGGQTVAPYTNSLVLNKKVILPLGSNESYNNKAIATYQEALPGYEIVGIKSNGNYPWYNTDALHCRTHEVPDEDMLFINHTPVQNPDNTPFIRINSEFLSYSNSEIKEANIHISVNGGDYVTYPLMQYKDTDNYYIDLTGLHRSDEVSYYIDGCDTNGKYNIEPTCGSLDPHHFLVS